MSTPEGFPFVCTHLVCGRIAFFMRRDPEVTGQPLSSEETVFPDGTEPEFGSAIICGSCGNPIAETDGVEVTRIQ